MVLLTGQWPLRPSVCVLTTRTVQHMTRNKILPDRGIISLPAVYGWTADDGHVNCL